MNRLDLPQTINGVDPIANLWRETPGNTTKVRESAWLAACLLRRHSPGDVAIAHRLLASVLNEQHDAPGQFHHGTFRRRHDEPDPPAQPMIWHHYDPNWREFIGVTLMTIQRHHEHLLDDTLRLRLDRALRLSAEGSFARPLPATYANIALMRVSLLDYCANHFHQTSWRREANDFARNIFEAFSEHDCFDEFNSATYYAVDLASLGLWVRHGSTPDIRSWGASMEAGLWRDIARFYHAGMRNLCGPFDRAYGMDMMCHKQGLTAWIDAAVAGCSEVADLFAAALDTGVRVPADALAELACFAGPRIVQRTIGSRPVRIATAWLSESLMIGGEDASFAKPIWSQYHPATAHWRTPDGILATIRLVPNLPTDARAMERQLETWCYLWHGTGGKPIRFRFEIGGIHPSAAQIDFHTWSLPGLIVRMQTNAFSMTTESSNTGIAVTYEADNLDSGSTVRFRILFEELHR